MARIVKNRIFNVLELNKKYSNPTSQRKITKILNKKNIKTVAQKKGDLIFASEKTAIKSRRILSRIKRL